MFDDDRHNDVRDVFTYSYRTFGDQAKRVFRRLPAHRAMDISTAELAHLVLAYRPNSTVGRERDGRSLRGRGPTLLVAGRASRVLDALFAAALGPSRWWTRRRLDGRRPGRLGRLTPSGPRWRGAVRVEGGRLA
ncbi:hypothetical protein JCM4814A_02960 [Streptomyces phaeofaciens JCM 4814]|uniref:Uncharacterized protein n=1 Tax=Streptomyces phaeofaciens TaxID=68254 RepID=A0A918HSV4_9ACTN|nr:hypothetical protein [Streptomyces phaeofaciens]GGT98562.1 hypothetical protein GCM10010226_89830 [Streptomyces phaeofaciens]